MEPSEILLKRLRKRAADAIADFSLIQGGDRVLVAVSGGKDSMSLLQILLSLQKAAKEKFELVAVNLDQGQPGWPAEVLPAWFEKLGVPFHIIKRDSWSVVERLVPGGETKCSLCGRLRRGHLYAAASELGATKIALGHHRDDLLATFFLNLFHAGQLKTMPPKLRSDDGRHIVIRPLAYCAESDLERLAGLMDFPVIPCTVCAGQPDLQRQVIRRMLLDWEARQPGRLDKMLGALGRVVPSHLLDPALADFAALAADGMARPGYRGGYAAGTWREGGA